ncbi:MAG: hypothetical protein QOH21_2117 [Acidobacteriota bacterium]|jgi:anti-sigma factor RsiW|nr:hypothetical protein [Acidobacteriota bacterium]
MTHQIDDHDLRAIRAQVEGEPAHPDLDLELFPYVDGTLPPERSASVDEHLEICARCREDVEDLRAVQPRRAGHHARRWPLALAASLLAVAIAAGMMMRDQQRPATLAPRTASIAGPSTTPVPLPVPAVRPPLPSPDGTATAAPLKRPSYARREWEKLVHAARAGTHLVMPAVLQAIRPAADRLRGAPQNSVAGLHPAGVVVETPRPMFTWPARGGARSVVSVFDGRREVVRSEPSAAPRWQPSHDLPRGVTYTWEVEVEQEGQVQILPSPPTPPAQFRVLDRAAVVELDEARREHGDDHLLLGLLYAKAGLDEDARVELQRVPEADAAVARRLLEDIGSWNGRS